MNIVPGYSVWEENDEETMFLTHYYSLKNKLCSFEALCLIQDEDLVKDTKLSYEDKLKFKKAFARQWLEYEALPKLEKHSYNDDYGYRPKYRGYVSNYPDYRLVDSWPNTEEGLLAIYINSVSFGNILSSFLIIPPFLENFRDRIIKNTNTFLSSDQVKYYLYKKAEEMADYWVSQIGGIGDSGNPDADMLHAVMASIDNRVFSDRDVKLFKTCMIDYTLEQFGKRRIPFYDTDYGVGKELRKVLKKSGLEEMSSKFPWKTWKHFDFNDAPVFTMN